MKYSSLDPEADRAAVPLTIHPDSNAAKRDHIVAVVARHTGVEVDAIMGPSRLEPIVVARHLAFLLAREISDLNTVQLGSLFGRNHGTIIKGMTSIQDRLDTEPKLRATFAAIRQELELPAL